jgi:nucleoid-associated protein YgaU
MCTTGVRIGVFFCVVGLLVTGCAVVQTPRQADDAKKAVETARAAGAPSKAPVDFQAAEQYLNQSQQLMASRDQLSYWEAERMSTAALISARSATVEARVRTDLDKVGAEAQAAKQEAGRATAALTAATQAAHAAENRAQQAESRAQQAEARAAQLERETAAIRAELAKPAPPPATYTRYVVKRSDTLKKIAARPEIYGDQNQWRRIYEANRDVIGKDLKLRTGLVLLIQK